MTGVVELVGVGKRYPGPPPVRALDAVDLHVGAGELVGVVGPSGSGKSTLLSVAGVLDRATSGTVRVAGYDVAALTARQRAALRAAHVGFVFQQFHLLPSLDAVENVATGLLYRGVGARRRRRDAVAALERVGLGHRLAHRPSQLSGGEQQRVALARAVVGSPSVLFADEPTGSLDTASGAAVMALLEEVAAAGTAVVVVTHDLEVAARLPRRVHVRDGRVEGDEGAAR